MNNKLSLLKAVPAVAWLADYKPPQFTADVIAALIVTVMLIPQSLAYAMLAGLPPELGLYASIWPLVLYALLGSSRVLSVGPVAVVSLMTSAAVGTVVAAGISDAITAAITLSLLSGVLLLVMGLFRLGFMVNFLSHGVVSGFITASGIIIAISQLKHILGVPLRGDTLWELGHGLVAHVADAKLLTLGVGACVLLFLFAARQLGSRLLVGLGMPENLAAVIARAAPVVGVLASIAAVVLFGLEAKQVALVGEIPKGLPSLTVTLPSLELIQALLVPALMIAVIGYVESISVGLTLAAKRRQTVDANAELVGLGAANIASGLSGAFPVTGGFSRSVVNYDAGAETQMASIFTAIAIALAALLLTPYLYYLPKATLAATIIIAVLSLLDFSIFKKTWHFSRADFWAISVTVAMTLAFGVELGVAAGVLTSLALFLYRSATPHMAEVGRVKGSEHFRNRERFEVEVSPHVYMLRIDESLFFANARELEQHIYRRVYERDMISDVVVVGSAINVIDYSALEALEKINHTLSRQGIRLHLCEIKGPVMDALARSHFLQALTGNVYLSQNEAFNALIANDAITV